MLKIRIKRKSRVYRTFPEKLPRRYNNLNNYNIRSDKNLIYNKIFIS